VILLPLLLLLLPLLPLLALLLLLLLPLLLHHLLLLHQHLLLLHLLHLRRLRRLRLLRLRPQHWLRLGALQPTSAAFTAARAATRTPRAARAAASNDELLGRDGVESRQLRRGALSPVHELLPRNLVRTCARR